MNTKQTSIEPLPASGLLGHVFEPKDEWALTTIPHSDCLVTVRRVTLNNGINSVIECKTHHGKRFECAVSCDGGPQSVESK